MTQATANKANSKPSQKTKKAKIFRPTYFAFPYLLLSLIFVILPLMLVFYYAFIGSDGSFSFENFQYVFSTKEYWISIPKTIGIALLTTSICLLISYPVAYILASSPFNKMAILVMLFIAPMWMNFVLRIMAMRSVFAIFGIGVGLMPSIVGLVYDFLPFMLMPIYTVIVNMDKSYIEASTDLGAGMVRTFLKVKLPLSLPGIISGITMVFMPVFSAYAVTDLLGDPSSNVIGYAISKLFSNEGTWGAGSVLSMILLFIVFLTLLLTNILTSMTKKRKAMQVKGGQLK